MISTNKNWWINTNWYQTIYSNVMKLTNLYWWIYTDVLTWWIYPVKSISMNLQWCHKLMNLHNLIFMKLHWINTNKSSLFIQIWWIYSDELKLIIYTEASTPKVNIKKIYTNEPIQQIYIIKVIAVISPWWVNIDKPTLTS